MTTEIEQGRTAGMQAAMPFMKTSADTTSAVCAFFNPDGASGTGTIGSKTDFLRALRSGYVEAVSRPLHPGRTVVVIETDVLDADGKLCARVTRSQAVLRS